MIPYISNKKKLLPHRTCLRDGCDNTFRPYRSWQRFCSPFCRNLHYETFIRPTGTNLAYAMEFLDKKLKQDKKKLEN